MTQFTYIDLSRLPPPPVDTLSYDEIRAAILAYYKGLYPDADLSESDPAIKVIDTVAYRELMVRQRINEGINAALLASESAALDYIGMRFGVERQVISPANNTTAPPTPAVLEANVRYRQRVQLALEGYSTAGSVGGYVYHAMSASTDVKDVHVAAPVFDYAQLTPELAAQLPAGTLPLVCLDNAGLTDAMPGDVAISILSNQGNGAPSAELQQQVLAALNADAVRPLSDRVRLQDITIVEFAIEATLTLNYGPDATSVIAAAQAAAQQYVDGNHKLGKDITLSGIYAALHRPGVHNVTLASPTADIIVNDSSAAYCTAISIIDGGRDD